MKSKSKKIASALICALLVLSLTACGSSSDTASSGSEAESSDVTSSGYKQYTVDVADGTAFKTLGTADNGYSIAAENGNYQLSINNKDLTVAVKDKSSGDVWKSNLTNEELNGSTIYQDTKNQYMSQLILTYYDDQNHKNTFNTYADAIGNYNEFSPTYKLYAIDNGVRVVYKIGNSIDYFLMPDCMTVETYKKLYNNLAPEDKLTMDEFYTYTKYSDIDPQQQSVYATTYKLITTEPLYMIKSVSKLQKERFVANALLAAGVTIDMVEEEYKTIGYNRETPVAANFVVTVDYTLTSSGLNVSIPSDKIEYDDTNYKLYAVTALPFFGAQIDQSEGYLFLPDGSGALFDVTNSTKNSIAFPFYGPDHSQWTKTTASNMQQATLPVFGMQYGDRAFIAYVDEGEAQGTVECHPQNAIFPYSYISSSYEINEFETYVSNGMSTTTNFQKYAEKPYEGNISINYDFLNGANANYVGMAKRVRERMFADKEKVSDTTEKFYLESYGEVLRSETLIGYAYNKKRALTTIDQLKDIYSQLNGNGVSNIALRYKNWYCDEYVNTLGDIGNVANSIGSKSDFKELSNFVSSSGGTFYPNMELVMEKDAGTLAQASTHSRLMEGTLVTYSGSNNLVKKAITVDYRRLANKSTYILEKISGIMSNVKKLNVSAVSLTTVGDSLFSDFSSKTVHRDTVKENVEEILKTVSDGNKILVDAGNAYALPYVTDVVDIPLSDSNLSFEYQSVPFLQIVLHGYVSYAGESLNLADNYKMSLLKSVEYGAGIRYILNYAQPELVKNTNYSDLYSTCYSRWIDQAAEDYKNVSAILNGLQGCCIENHEKLTDEVYKTTYDNGTAVLVNYSSADYNYNGTVVAAGGYAAVK